MTDWVRPIVTLRQAECLVGIPYVTRRFDCAHLAVLAQAVLFKRRVAGLVPEQHPWSPREQARVLLRWRAELATHAGVGRSVLERLQDCRKRLLVVEGVYAWNMEHAHALA